MQSLLRRGRVEQSFRVRQQNLDGASLRRCGVRMIANPGVSYFKRSRCPSFSRNTSAQSRNDREARPEKTVSSFHRGPMP